MRKVFADGGWTESKAAACECDHPKWCTKQCTVFRGVKSHLLDLLEDNLFQIKQSMIPSGQSQRKAPEVDGLTKMAQFKFDMPFWVSLESHFCKITCVK